MTLHNIFEQFVRFRTMATWGSTPCRLEDDEDDEYNPEMGADEEEEQDECTESSSDDDIQLYSRNQSSYSNRKNQGRSERQDKDVTVAPNLTW